MSVRETIQERAEQGGFGIGPGLIAIGNRVGRAIPRDIRDNVRENTDNPALETGTRIRDGLEYIFRELPAGRAAGNAADGIDNAIDRIRDSLPDAGMARVAVALLLVLVGSVALGQLFNINIGGS